MGISLNDISIRTDLRPGDMGYVIYLHGDVYSKEYGYTIAFENYVAAGLHDFVSGYNPERDATWVCEHQNHIVGFLLLADRGNGSAQLRYFLLLPEYRGIGLGKKLMDLFMQCLEQRNYSHAFLWTTNEQHEAASLYRRYGFRLTDEKGSIAFGKQLKEQRYDLRLISR